MYHFDRNPQLPSFPHKSFSSIAYRRSSVPQITAYSDHSPSPFYSAPYTHRTPLAPIDPQGTHVTHNLADDQMSTSSSSPLLSYAQFDPAQDRERDRERPGDLLRYNIGRPIAPIRSPSDAYEASLSPARRRSIPNHSPSASFAIRPPTHLGRPISRRPSHTTSLSVSSSSRRPSLPAILLQPSSPTSHPPVANVSISTNDHNVNPAFGNNTDDLYSDLSSYTFGSARPSRPEFLEMISPFSSVSGTNSAERTPRPSISGPSLPSSHQPARVATRSRTPRTHAKDIEDDGARADDEDEDEAERQMRTKMRAMNDGTRRPSLPINTYSSGRSKSPASSLHSKVSPQQSPASPMDHDSVHSGAESESSTNFGEGDDDDAEVGEFDTDVEFDFHHNSVTPASHDPMSDAASQHTFGGDYGLYVYNPNSDQDDRMSITGDDDESDRNDIMPTFTTTEYATDAEGNLFPLEGRRGSRPWIVSGIPTASGPGPSRDREDSMATVTAMELKGSLCGEHPGPIDGADRQEAHAPGQRQDVAAPESDDPLRNNANALEGFDLGYIFNHVNERGEHNSWQSADSWMQVSPPAPGGALVIDGRQAGFEAFEFDGWGTAVTGATGRRPSTITVGSASEDAFTRHVQRFDPVSHERAVEWSFRREAADGSGPAVPLGARWVQTTNTSRVVAPGTQEIWRHAHVGRFKVDRLLMRHGAVDDPSKPPSQRVNVRHIADPFSKANTHGGPMSVVHKHSRAVAFSIFRKYDIFSHRQGKPGAASMPTSGSILLATRKVQEQYTSTRTTNQLKSHGLLRDGDRSTRGQTSTTSSASESGPSSHTLGRSHSRDRHLRDRSDTQKGKKDKKGKGKESASESTGTSSQSTSMGSVSSRTTANDEESVQFAKPYASSASSGPSAPVSPTIAETQYTFSSSVSEFTAARYSADGPFSSKYGSPPPTASSERAQQSVILTRVDDDDDQAPPRTSHAEAFATLDQNSIEYFRGRTEQRLSDHDSSHARSITERLRRRLLGQNPVKVISRPPSGPPTAALEGHYTPPWMTMAPRSRVEERDRVIQNLNESFKDVGLLPSFKTKNGGKTKRRERDDKVNIFSHVPGDSLHMLLPLWPGETDPHSVVPEEDPAIYTIPVEERQYLLVYYIPLEEREDEKKKQENKKRSRSNARATGSASASGTVKSIQLTAFSVCARLISYGDLLGTGVKVPLDGLSITGPMAQAMRSLPSAAVRESRLETPCAIIGICYGRDKGIEFLPDGLAKVGLAVALPSSTPERTPVSVEAEAEELNWEMTPIGRAAVEMAWLGCLSMTSFGSGPSPSR